MQTRTRAADPDTTTTLTFQIFLDQKVKHNVSVDYATQDGTAKAGVNYTHTSGTVTFAPREQVKTVDVVTSSRMAKEAPATSSSFSATRREQG